MEDLADAQPQVGRKYSSFVKYHPKRKLGTQVNHEKYCTVPNLNKHSSNLHNIESFEDAALFYSPFPFRFNFPLPIRIIERIPRTVINGLDPITQLPKKKQLWKARKSVIWNLFRKTARSKKGRDVSRFLDTLKDGEAPEMQPCITAKMAHHISINPDKYFKGIYNWYYGNTMKIVKIYQKYYIFSVGGEGLNDLRMRRIKLSKRSGRINIKSEYKLQLKTSTPIYDIIVSNSQELVGIRQRDMCSFMVGNVSDEDTDFVFGMGNYVCVKSDEYPFVSFDCIDDEFCTFSTDRIIKLWDLEAKKKCKIKRKVSPVAYNSNLHANVKYCSNNPNVILVMDKSAVFSFDKRTELKEPSSVWQCKKETESCEEMSLLFPAYKSRYWYVGLTHSVLTLDTRAGFVQKWTHMLPQTPSVGCVQQFDDGSHCEELVHIACQASNNVITLYNDWTSNFPTSNSLPFSGPTCPDTLINAQINGVCLDPNLQCRFKDSIIGLESYHTKNRFGLLQSKSTGDIFYQHMTRFHEDSDNLANSDFEYLQKWENDISEISAENTELNCTDIFYMQSIFDRIDTNNVVIPDDEKTDSILKDSWKISKKELEKYTDFLAPVILEGFGMDEESEWELTDEEELEEGIPKRIRSKVQNWLGDDDSEKLSEPDVSDIAEFDDNAKTQYSSDGNDTDYMSVSGESV